MRIQIIASAAVMLVLSAMASPGAPAQAADVEVITLKYRTAEQVIPMLRPLLEPGATLTGMQNQLIVRTSPRNLDDIRKVLATVDAMPRRLQITVRQDAVGERERTSAQVSGRVVAGNAGVTVVDPARGDAAGVAQVRSGDSVVRGRIDSERAQAAGGVTQALQVLEGNSAFINFGQSAPVPQRQVTRSVVNGQIVERVSSTVEYRDALTGFYVLPRVSGDRVVLEISPQRETFATPEQNLPRGSVNVQRAATTVTGRLGEWIEIGGIAQAGSSQQSVILGSTRESALDSRRILLKVDELR